MFTLARQFCTSISSSNRPPSRPPSPLHDAVYSLGQLFRLRFSVTKGWVRRGVWAQGHAWGASDAAVPGAGRSLPHSTGIYVDLAFATALDVENTVAVRTTTYR